MSTFVLVHGAWHGAWCWERVTPFLTQAGHRAVAVDMPAMGDDRTPVSEAVFPASVAAIVKAVDAAAEPVVIVAHSMGGIAVTQAAEERPDTVAKLIYVTSFLPKNGESCMSLATTDSSTVVPGLEFSPTRDAMTVRDDWIKVSFFNDCTDEDAAWATAKLRPQPTEPFAHPATLTPERCGRVKRAYIECLRDHAITPGFQRKMYTDNPCETVLTLDAGHSPFINMPKELAGYLISLAG